MILCSISPQERLMSVHCSRSHRKWTDCPSLSGSEPPRSISKTQRRLRRNTWRKCVKWRIAFGAAEHVENPYIGKWRAESVEKRSLGSAPHASNRLAEAVSAQPTLVLVFVSASLATASPDAFSDGVNTRRRRKKNIRGNVLSVNACDTTERIYMYDINVCMYRNRRAEWETFSTDVCYLDDK